VCVFLTLSFSLCACVSLSAYGPDSATLRCQLHTQRETHMRKETERERGKHTETETDLDADTPVTAGSHESHTSD